MDDVELTKAFGAFFFGIVQGDTMRVITSRLMGMIRDFGRDDGGGRQGRSTRFGLNSVLDRWRPRQGPDPNDRRVVVFCADVGITELRKLETPLK